MVQRADSLGRKARPRHGSLVAIVIVAAGAGCSGLTVRMDPTVGDAGAAADATPSVDGASPDAAAQSTSASSSGSSGSSGGSDGGSSGGGAGSSGSTGGDGGSSSSGSGSSGSAGGDGGSSSGGSGSSASGGTTTNLDAGICIPKTCAELGYNCDLNGDVCGGIIDCGSCTAPEFCGGGGFSKCGSGGLPPPDSGPLLCIPRGCASFPAGTCGLQGDGCGGTTGPCTMCASSEFCGGGGPGLCGTGIDAGGSGDAAGCTPKTCADYPAATCGQQVDGCGGLTETCGANDAGGLCPSGQFCGGGGPSLCGG